MSSKQKLGVGLISDVHGDVDSLNTAVKKIRKKCPNGRILCAGDVVGRGPYPNAVIDVLREEEIDSVLGNHDEYALNSHRSSPKGVQFGMSAATAHLSVESMEYLRWAPLVSYYCFKGIKICVTHGTPVSNKEYLWEEEISDRLIEEISRLDVDVLVVGHTHKPMDILVGCTRVINPGSVCHLSRRDSHTCALLHLTSLQVEFLPLG